MAEVYEFFVAIEGHWVIAQVANVGLSHLYIDDEWHDTYHPDPFNLWGPYNLFEPQPSSQHPGSVPFSMKAGYGILSVEAPDGSHRGPCERRPPIEADSRPVQAVWRKG
jgi:hypothetical protein